MTIAYPPQPPAVFVATHQDNKGNPYMLAANIYWDDYGAPAGHITSPRVDMHPLQQETKPANVVPFERKPQCVAGFVRSSECRQFSKAKARFVKTIAGVQQAGFAAEGYPPSWLPMSASLAPHGNTTAQANANTG